MVLNFFIAFQGGDDPEFIHKAIESLVKKLKDRREQLFGFYFLTLILFDFRDALISAVTSAGKQPSGCVAIHVFFVLIFIQFI